MLKSPKRKNVLVEEETADVEVMTEEVVEDVLKAEDLEEEVTEAVVEEETEEETETTHTTVRIAQTEATEEVLTNQTEVLDLGEKENN